MWSCRWLRCATTQVSVTPHVHASTHVRIANTRQPRMHNARIACSERQLGAVQQLGPLPRGGPRPFTADIETHTDTPTHTTTHPITDTHRDTLRERRTERHTQTHTQTHRPRNRHCSIHQNKDTATTTDTDAKLHVIFQSSEATQRVRQWSTKVSRDVADLSTDTESWKQLHEFCIVST